MGLNYELLDATTRHLMIEEIDRDVANSQMYRSSRLNDNGWAAWISLLKEAAHSHDDDWLAGELRSRALLNSHETRTRGATTHTAAVPHTAPETLAEGEFNRFYIRAVCRRALDQGGGQVEIYRGRHSTTPRPESEAKVGQQVAAQSLLDDLRQGGDKALDLPSGPNSGLTVRLPK